MKREYSLCQNMTVPWKVIGVIDSDQMQQRAANVEPLNMLARLF